VELQACKRAAQLAEEVSAMCLHIEMDCKEVVSKLQNSSKDLSPLGPMIEEVKKLLEKRQQWKVSWVRHSANGAAHGLAKEGVSNNLCKVWLHEPPDCILNIVSAEIPACYE
jgi:ribonuclease HI